MNETSLDRRIASMALVDTSGDAFSSEGNLTGLPPELGSGLLSMDNLLALAMNMSLAERCRLQQQAEEGLQDVACPSFFDKVSCWPRTPPNTTAVLPCFAELSGVPYDSSHTSRSRAKVSFSVPTCNVPNPGHTTVHQVNKVNLLPMKIPFPSAASFPFAFVSNDCLKDTVYLLLRDAIRVGGNEPDLPGCHCLTLALAQWPALIRKPSFPQIIFHDEPKVRLCSTEQ
ncbi:AGAP005464-PA-like protein [Anopheles sinensis]|uniref:AGAP005464-PA-like protein n=1 Tax=Anopheles sinensis TaxID=74873 RepID=A0A084W2U9_ANOSI|nr:AGAP005464-PA-like protein [Anopheles sinensis]